MKTVFSIDFMHHICSDNGRFEWNSHFLWRFSGSFLLPSNRWKFYEYVSKILCQNKLYAPFEFLWATLTTCMGCLRDFSRSNNCRTLWINCKKEILIFQNSLSSFIATPFFHFSWCGTVHSRSSSSTGPKCFTMLACLHSEGKILFYAFCSLRFYQPRCIHVLKNTEKFWEYFLEKWTTFHTCSVETKLSTVPGSQALQCILVRIIAFKPRHPRAAVVVWWHNNSENSTMTAGPCPIYHNSSMISRGFNGYAGSLSPHAIVQWLQEVATFFHPIILFFHQSLVLWSLNYLPSS